MNLDNIGKLLFYFLLGYNLDIINFNNSNYNLIPKYNRYKLFEIVYNYG